MGERSPTCGGTWGFANYVPDNNYAITWQENMTETLEWYAQNATLSLLSGQIFALGSPDGTELLENFTTNCDIILTVYEYTPGRLFTTYGVAVFSTILCIVAGCISIRQNGVEESMDFSRFPPRRLEREDVQREGQMGHGDEDQGWK